MTENDRLMRRWDLIVVGGGAAGLVTALTAARQGKSVLILERTDECGKKLAITGGKKGNFTHADEPAIMAQQYNTEPQVLFGLMRRFPYQRIIRFFEELGIGHQVDEDGCVWPIPKSAPRLRAALVAAVRAAGAIIHTKARVIRITPGWQVHTAAKTYSAAAVLIATGGISHPATGSSGDGYELARSVGHRIVPGYSALASLKTAGEFAQLAGITIGKTTVRLRIGTDAVIPRRLTETGPFLFAREYITGRPVINLSGFAAQALQNGKAVQAVIDWLPDLPEELLKRELTALRDRYGRRQVNNFIATRTAKRLANLLVERAGLPPERTVSGLSRAELRKLLAVLKQTEITIIGTEPVSRATVTGGGVALEEVDLLSGESRLQPGLFFAGEILDVWGRSGGYNLHFAWATGIAVGEAVSRISNH